MDLRNRPIGVFDSGVGGLTAVSELRKILPHEDIIYLGDTARVPYGTKSRDTILKYAAEDLAFLKRRGVKFAIAACGTVSSVMVGESAFKVIAHNAFTDEICTGVIGPAVDAACRATKNKKIGVIATAASIRSGNYEKLIKAAMPDIEVISTACPMFVPLVENGYIARDCAPTVAFAREYLDPMKERGIDTLILGCTHYPLLSGVISDVVGENVTLISSGAEAARYAKSLLEKNDLLSEKSEAGRINLYCTDSEELFRENVRHFIDLDGITVERRSVED